MKVSRMRVTVVVALALASCASEPRMPPIGAPAPVPAVSWDGTYRGTIQITGVGSGAQRDWCETDLQMVVQVTANSFTYALPHPNVLHNPTPIYSATIASSGTFQSRIGSGVMTGQVAGSHMSGTIDGSLCAYAFSADRS